MEVSGAFLFPIIAVVALIAMSVKVLREYERGVVFFLGRFQAVKGPGLIIIIPGIQQMVKVDLSARSATSLAPLSSLQLPSQDLEPVGCLYPDLDLVPSAGSRGDDDLLARLTVDDEDLFVNAAGQ